MSSMIKQLANTMAWARQCKTAEYRDSAIGLLDSYRDKDELTDEIRAELLFTLANLHDKQGNFANAFADAQAGHALKTARYDPADFSRYVDALIAATSASRMARLPRARHGSRKPIFIVGLPRSGTTLTEQILCSHPQVYGAGELREIMNIADTRPDLTQAVLDAAAARYLALIDQLAPDHDRVTDKMPHNFQHLALIKLLFPDSAIIHCRRDARDTCLSCYLHNFAGHHPYTHDLTWLGMHYRNYARLMQHWNTIGLPMLEVSYEQMVAEPEATMRGLLAYCDLPWDDACMRFHENSRVANTASREQVQRPIYNSAIGRWKHYEKQLAPLIEALGAPFSN